MKNSFIFQPSYLDAVERLDEMEMYKTLYAIVKYGVTGVMPDNINNITQFALDLIKPNIDASIKKYKAQKENGKKGGRPKKNPTETQTKPNKNPTETQVKPNKNLDYDYNSNYDYNCNYNLKENTQKKTFESVLECVLDKELKNSLQEFLELRKQLNKPLTPYALELSIQRLNTMSTNIQEQIAIVKQSIVKGWLDFYPLNTEKPTKAKNRGLDDIAELYAEELAKENNQDIIIEE